MIGVLSPLQTVRPVTPGPPRPGRRGGRTANWFSMTHTARRRRARAPGGDRGTDGPGRAGPTAGRFGNAVQSLVRALEARDPYTRGHSRRVSAYAAAIARELGLSYAAQRDIRLAAQLHDVGKIGIPDALLLKAGPLTREEYERVLDHTTIGEAVLRPVLHHRPGILAVIRWHHERFDGRGLPDGLRRWSIPLGARIVAVADAFDAMTSSRPYRSGLTLGRAMRELELGAGSQFDPACVCAFLAVLGRLLRTKPGGSARAIVLGRVRLRTWGGTGGVRAAPWLRRSTGAARRLFPHTARAASRAQAGARAPPRARTRATARRQPTASPALFRSLDLDGTPRGVPAPRGACCRSLQVTP